MPKLTHLQNSFAAGELSPLLKGRTSLAQYQNGCEILTNLIVLPQGGVTKRPGTKFVREVKNSADTTRLLPFIVGNDQSYVLEFGDSYIRFYRNGGILLSTAAITNGTFATNLTGWTDNDTGTGASTWSTGVMRLNGGAAGVAARTQAVTYVGTSQYTLTFTVATNDCTYRIGTTLGGTEIASGTGSVGSNSINFTPATNGTIYIQFRNANNNDSDVGAVALNTPVYQIASPYTDDKVEALQWAQSKDVMYITHGDVSLRKLRRFGASQWDIVAVDLVDGPYYNKTDADYGGVGTGFTLTPSGTTGSVTLTASGAVFASTDVGRAVRYRPSTSDVWSELTITAYSSSTAVTALVQKTLAGTTGSTEWRLGYFSDTTGHPACVTFHEQRLVLANTTDRPQTVWFSRSGDIEVFQPDNDSYKDEVDDTSAMTYTLASRDTNDIVWLSSRNVLYLGSYGAIFAAKASSLDEAITPNNISIKPVVKTAAHNAMPIETSNATLFIQYHQRKVVELAYNVSSDNMVGVDLTILSEHLSKNKFKFIARQEEPYDVLWAISETGELFGLTYIRDQQVVGWHKHVLGGTDVSVESIVTIPGAQETELWLIVSRTIDGSIVQYVEQLSPYFRDYVEDVEAFFVDSGINYDGTSTSAITGLDHLEGETVVALTNGFVAVVEDDVASGSIALQDATTYANIGLPYSAFLKTMPIELSGPSGTIQGSLVRAWKSFIRLYRSALIKVGYSSGDSNILENFADNYTMGGSVPLVSAQKEIAYDHGTELEIATYVEQTQPVPLTILTVGTKIVVDDDR
jgi:hypothetical protein